MFKLNFTITSSQADCLQKMKVSSLFTMFQELSVQAVEKSGQGKTSTLDRGYLWIVEKVILHINRYPRYLEQVSFETYPSEMIHFLYPRTYIMKDKNGNVLLIMKALWILMNQKTRKIALPSQTGIIVPGEKKEDLKDFSREIPELDVKMATSRKIGYTDVDINNHLNNEKYIEYMLDLKSSEYYASHEIVDLSIEFKKEVKEGSTLSIYQSETNPSYILSKEGDQVVYRAYVSYKDI